MQPVEAINRLIAESDSRRNAFQEKSPDSEEWTDGDKAWIEELGVALAVCQAMLNTAIPVSRFRCFVEVDEEQPPRKGADPEEIRQEFTVCGVTIGSVMGGLVGLQRLKTNVRITLWEQRSTGADMISGYQGATKTLQYRNWLKSLPELEAPPSLN